jgi:CRP-like cAMP-binding protein
LKVGGVFGELSLDEVPCENAFAEAVTDVRVAKVGKSALNEVIKRRPSLAMKLFFAFSERLRHQDLANMIFSTREAVSKEMSEFQRAGLIEVRKRKISVSPQLAKSLVSDPSWSPGAAA